MAAVKRRCTADPDLHAESIFINLQIESRKLSKVHDQSTFIWDVFDSNRGPIGFKGSVRNCQPHSPDRFSKGDGKQALLGRFPSLISSIHSNGMEDFLQR
ncbi:hypothetical protein D6D10_04972 [Aureobasidium pullulans]|uniref:Uncharacterized protein n=1 Tax=Aureobasidium pullulans TaxID=5580 RepID=A0A4S9EVD7_AURPU|nr:hypothetical protein D6D10_04972 [Aureobasidium pullulans]